MPRNKTIVFLKFAIFFLVVKSILQPPLLPARHTYMFTYLNTEINIPTLLLLYLRDRSCIFHKRKSACISIMMFLSSKYSPLRSILGNQIANMESKFVFQSKKDFIESTRKIYRVNNTVRTGQCKAKLQIFNQFYLT